MWGKLVRPEMSSLKLHYQSKKMSELLQNDVTPI
jgi:hypothetical protein